MSDLKVSLILQLKNLLKGGIGQARNDIKGLKTDVDGLARSSAKIGGTSTILAGLSRATLAIGGLGGAMALTTGKAISFEKAMADVRKKVDGADDPVVYAMIEAEVKRMALAYGIAQNEMAQLVAEAGASGIAVKDLSQFMNVAAKAAVGWDMSAQQAAQTLAQIKAGAQLTTTEISDLADMINYLGDSSAAKERDIVDMFQRSSEAAKAAGSDTRTTLAFLTGARSMGVAPEVGARWFGAFTSKLIAPTKKGIEALKGLGLSLDGVKKGMETKPFETMVKVLEKLKDSAKRAEFAKDLFGQEWFDETLRVAGGLNEVKKAYSGLQNTANWRGSLNKGLQVQLNTTANHLDRLKVLVSDIGDRLGRWALPPINAGIEKLIALMDRLKGVTEYDRQRREADEAAKVLADYEAAAQQKKRQADVLTADAKTARNPKDKKTLLARAKRLRDEQEVLQQQADDAREVARARALTAVSGRAEKQQEPNDLIKKGKDLLDKKLGDPFSDIGPNDTVETMRHRLNALNYAAKKPELQAEKFQNQIKRSMGILRDHYQMAGGKWADTDAGKDEAAASKRREDIAKLNAEIEATRTKLANLPPVNPFGSKESRERLGAKREALEAELTALKAKLAEISGEAEKTGAAIKDKLSMDLSGEGARAGASYAAGLAGSAPAVSAAAESLATLVKNAIRPAASISPPAAPLGGGSRPLTGGSAAGPRSANVQVAAIHIHGVSDPDRAAKKAVAELAGSLRSTLSGAHHDGVA